jgi:hypothetical protein
VGCVIYSAFYFWTYIGNEGTWNQKVLNSDLPGIAFTLCLTCSFVIGGFSFWNWFLVLSGRT